MIISGSTALQFFERVLYPESDLDLYVEHRYMHPIALWLASIGYRYIQPINNVTVVSEEHDGNGAMSISATHSTLEEALEAVPPERPAYPTVRGHFPRILFRSFNRGYMNAISILNFEKSDESHERCKVQIIATPRSPVEMILNFHSTGVMNFITHEKAYSLYPRATFEERRSVMCLYNTPSRRKAYAKYAERVLDGITGDDFHNINSSLARGPRHVGDSRTWTIPILPRADDPPQRALTEMNSLCLKYTRQLKPAFEFSLLISPHLRHCYLVLDEFVREQIRKIPILLKKSPCGGEDPHAEMLESLAEYLNEVFE